MPILKKSVSGHQVSGRWHTRCSHLLSLYASAPRDDCFTTMSISVEGAFRHVCDFSVIYLLPFCRLVCTAEKVFVFLTRTQIVLR